MTTLLWKYKVLSIFMYEIIERRQIALKLFFSWVFCVMPTREEHWFLTSWISMDRYIFKNIAGALLGSLLGGEMIRLSTCLGEGTEHVPFFSSDCKIYSLKGWVLMYFTCGKFRCYYPSGRLAVLVYVEILRFGVEAYLVKDYSHILSFNFCRKITDIHLTNMTLFLAKQTKITSFVELTFYSRVIDNKLNKWII